ncbi:hypothetical protein FAIPA1_210075 [Frankia sp. AiPs1]
MVTEGYSAIAGRFVKQSIVKRNLKTTVTEPVRRRKSR